MLQEPVFAASFVLRKDASRVGVAALLMQENKGKLYPVGYASKLRLAEARYHITEKECMAVVWSIRRFKLYIVPGWQEVCTPDGA